MESAHAQSPRLDACARCTRPVPSGIKRCPYCSAALVSQRTPVLWLGGAILAAVLLLVGLVVHSMRQEDGANVPKQQETTTPELPPSSAPLDH